LALAAAVPLLLLPLLGPLPLPLLLPLPPLLQGTFHMLCKPSLCSMITCNHAAQHHTATQQQTLIVSSYCRWHSSIAQGRQLLIQVLLLTHAQHSTAKSAN
jgi:hypothetical protein